MHLTTVHLPNHPLANRLLNIEFSESSVAEYVFGNSWIKCRDDIPMILRYIPMSTMEDDAIGTKMNGEFQIYNAKSIVSDIKVYEYSTKSSVKYDLVPNLTL